MLDAFALERAATTRGAAVVGVALAVLTVALTRPPPVASEALRGSGASSAPLRPTLEPKATPRAAPTLPELDARQRGGSGVGSSMLSLADTVSVRAAESPAVASAPAALPAPPAPMAAALPADTAASQPEPEPGAGRGEPKQPVPPPPGPLEISDVRIDALSSASARISWRTSLPAATQGGRGFASAPTVFTAAAPPALEHETLFSGLDFATSYHVWLRAVDAWGRIETVALRLQTPGLPERTLASVEGDTILRDGEPFFPLVLWRQCAQELWPKLAEGINLFMGNGCGADARLLDALAGQAFAVVANGATEGRGLLGWHHPDEWDERLPATLSPPELRALAPEPPQGLLDFLTLTNHFYSRAEPLPQGRGIYPSLATLPDVVGFDLYPLQIWCRNDRFADVYDSQRELHELSQGRPTYQWIEVEPMEVCGGERHLRPTPATVRAETWLAIAGGADGIGYFPNNWSPEVGAEIARTNRQIEELAPALLGEPREAPSDSPAVKVSARELGGALYVIAVNSSTAPVEATLRVPGVGARELAVYDEQRELLAAEDAFRDSFAPLAVHIYVAPPEGWSADNVSALPADAAQLETAATAGQAPAALDLSQPAAMSDRCAPGSAVADAAPQTC